MAVTRVAIACVHQGAYQSAYQGRYPWVFVFSNTYFCQAHAC